MKYISFVEKNEDQYIVINAENINREAIELDDSATIITYAEFDNTSERNRFSEFQSKQYGSPIFRLGVMNDKQTLDSLNVV